MRVKELADPVAVEPPRSGEDAGECVACNTPDDAYIWVSERWRVRAMDRPTGLPMVLILECRSHLDLGDLPNLLAAELGVMTVRLERAIRSLDGVARVHVNRWGDGSAHLHMWFLARPYGRLQLRGTFLSLWDDILPTIPEPQWRENLALVAAWLAEFGGQANAEPPHIQWQSPLTFSADTSFRSGDPETSSAGSEALEKASREAGMGTVPPVIEPAETVAGSDQESVEHRPESDAGSRSTSAAGAATAAGNAATGMGSADTDTRSADTGTGNADTGTGSIRGTGAGADPDRNSDDPDRKSETDLSAGVAFGADAPAAATTEGGSPSSRRPRSLSDAGRPSADGSESGHTGGGPVTTDGGTSASAEGQPLIPHQIHRGTGAGTAFFTEHRSG